jgi:hypothetical protein
MTTTLAGGLTIPRRELAAALAAEAFSAYVRGMKQRLGLQQVDVIERVKTGVHAISIYGKDLWEVENGKRIPREPLMSALIGALEMDPRHVERTIAYGAERAAALAGVESDVTLDTLKEEARAYGGSLAEERLRDKANQVLLAETAEGVPVEQIEQALDILKALYAKSPERAREYLALGTFYVDQAKTP